MPQTLNRRRSLAASLKALAGLSLVATAVAVTPGAATAGATNYQASCPVKATISQGYHSGHDGIDLAAPYGTPMYSIGPGSVTHSGSASGYGNWIRIKHPDGAVSEYGHMRNLYVRVGQQVNGGQHIADVASEGQSSGPHLHFEIHRNGGMGFGDNPITYLRERGLSLPCTPGGNNGNSNFTTWGSGIRVRSDAKLNASVVTTLGGPTAVYVDCQKQGDTVNAEGHTNNWWAHLKSHNGFISNIYIDHPAAQLPNIPVC